MVLSIAQPLRRLGSAFGGAQHSCKLALVACFTVTLAACDPALDRVYSDEGAGVSLYTTSQAQQIVLLDEYFTYLCAQAAGRCGDYSTLVLAGMNDIDLRCDGYLTWLDARRRDKAPVLAELAAVGTTVHDIMTVTGSNPVALNIVASAFGLAAITYNQWNSRLLISLENSTVQEVVYTSQGKYRDQIKNWSVPDRPSAIYLLRNYLRLCMPITIEANVNVTTKLVKRGDTEEAQQNLVVSNTKPTPAMIRRVSNVTSRLETPFISPRPVENPTKIGRYEQNMSTKDLQFVLNKALCLKEGTDLGPAGSVARKKLESFLTDNGEASSQIVTVDVWDHIRRIVRVKKPQCA